MMKKKLLITGATAGIGRETAKGLAAEGHDLLVHGRSAEKVEALERELAGGPGAVEGLVADLSRMADVEALAETVLRRHDSLDVLINNAGVFSTAEPLTPEGRDVRFEVNTVAPYLLSGRLTPILGARGRVISLSSAAQNPVSLDALRGRVRLDDFEAYAQSKLALTMWSAHLGRTAGDRGPIFVAVNPGSMLGTKMVEEAFGVAGKDVRIGSSILTRLALADDAAAQGAYFDNDAGRFARPHPDALDAAKCAALVDVIEGLVAS